LIVYPRELMIDNRELICYTWEIEVNPCDLVGYMAIKNRDIKGIDNHTRDIRGYMKELIGHSRDLEGYVTMINREFKGISGCYLCGKCAVVCSTALVGTG
jgi:hypothetical protein